MSDGAIGLISDCPLQRHLMQSTVQSLGYTIAVNTDPTRLEKADLERYPAVRAWVVSLTDEDRWDESLSKLIEYTEIPVLFGLGEAPCKQSRDFLKWERRLFNKLKDLLGEPSEAEAQLANIDSNEYFGVKPPAVTPLSRHIIPRGPADDVERVVVLAASLGGPAAVKEFLDCLPAGLPAAFVYAQHIDQNAANVLLRVLGRHSELSLHEARAGNKLCNGEIIVVPVEHEISFDDEGLIVFHHREWPGPYGPSINQVMLNVANYYQSKTHVILFSGMGNDGATAGPLLKANDSLIWCQNSESCVSSSMPDAVAATGCVEFRGTPSELAEKLVRTIEHEELKKAGKIATNH